MASRWCPCPSPWESSDMDLMTDASMDTGVLMGHRRLQESEEPKPQPVLWEMIYVGIVLVIMFAVLLTDKIGADLVMLATLTACMAANIITVSEGVMGFSNEGVLTVMVLFVVAAGVQMTGGLDWYMSKLLGRPANAVAAQLRLMLPISVVSAFLNNTPVVVIMIPILQKWGKNIGVSPAQLLVPLSFASILGGTCTLIGTSTNLVVAGLLKEAFPNDPNMQVGLFSLGEYGVPIAFLGMAYILVASPYLLPGGKRREDTTQPDDDGSILLKARVTKWSPAAGRHVKRSGLRDTGGVYLVSVERARSGNLHRAVGQDFVLNVGDILYFAGMVEGFGQFCEDHGLEVVTRESTNNTIDSQDEFVDNKKTDLNNRPDPLGETNEHAQERRRTVRFGEVTVTTAGGDDVETPSSPATKYVGDKAEKLQAINRLSDMIKDFDPSRPFLETNAQEECKLDGPAQIVVSVDTENLETLVTVGINMTDRPGLLLDVPQVLKDMKLYTHHTEATKVQGRSISVWRCAPYDDSVDLDESKIRDGLFSILEVKGGDGAAKQGGLPVLRALVTDQSQLVGKTLEDVDFRESYGAGVVAVRKKDKSLELEDLTEVCFSAGDILVVQAENHSPLLVKPPEDFYTKADTNAGYAKTFLSAASDAVNALGRVSDGVPVLGRKCSQESSQEDRPDEGEEDVTKNAKYDASVRTLDVWRDLRIIFHENEGDGNNVQQEESREFLASVKVIKKSEHIGKTVTEAGLDRQAGLFLVGVERPVCERQAITVSFVRYSVAPTPTNRRLSLARAVSTTHRSQESNVPTTSIPVPPEGHLKEGDVLWFAGDATAIADLRKIPGLVSTEEDNLKLVDEAVHDRRLVQAVVAKSGPLVGKTPAEVRFGARYGAAVIAVHRDGTRVSEPPRFLLPQNSVNLSPFLRPPFSLSLSRFKRRLGRSNCKSKNYQFLATTDSLTCFLQNRHAGDVLLLEAGPTFIANNVDNQHSFALISEVKDSKPPRLDKLIPSLVLVLAMLVIVAIGPYLFPDQNMSSLFVCGLVTSAVMVCFKILSQQECRDCLNWEVYITIACAFGIGAAMENSGLAGVIADGLVGLGQAVGIGDAGLFGAVYFATFAISNIVTNNAAAALMFPIAIDAANQTGADPLLMSYNLMLAASACFMSPFGYTTNLLVYGTGGYKVKDFLKIGTPLQLLLWIITTLLLTSSSTPSWVSWVWSFGLLFLVCLVFVFPSVVRTMMNRAREASVRGSGSATNLA
ncbi:hypothetical protein ACHAWF_010378 [Thalassiosira exigua]